MMAIQLDLVDLQRTCVVLVLDLDKGRLMLCLFLLMMMPTDGVHVNVMDLVER